MTISVVDILTHTFAGVVAKTNELVAWANALGSSTDLTATGGTLSGIEMTSSTVDSTPIGQTSPSAGAFTTLTASTPLPLTSGGTGAVTAAGARTVLGIGSLGAQNANAADITGGTIVGITDLAIADGGTGASTAAGARTNLGLGSMSVQNANAVDVTGGTIRSGVTIEGLDATGHVVQTTYGEYAPGTTVTFTSLIPNASTPTITDGTQIISLSITPKKIGNKIRVRFLSGVTATTTYSGQAATLFVYHSGGATPCRNAAWVRSANNTLGYPGMLTLGDEFTTTSLDPVIISVRFGPCVAGYAGSAITVMGSSGKATLFVEEIGS